MNTNEINIGDKVKIQRRSEHSKGFVEVARGFCVGLADGKFTKFIKFIEDKNLNLDQSFAEPIPVSADYIRVIKW